MKHIPFGTTGEMVSPYCLGTMIMGTQTDRPTSLKMLDRFLDLGGNFLDTANCYAWWSGKTATGDESETLLGEWMRERGNRNKVFLATKGGARLKSINRVRDGQGNVAWDKVVDNYEYLSTHALRKAAEDSLRRLGTDHIDLYYVHIDDRRTPQEETLEVLNNLVKEGKVRYIACSNFRTWRMERARSISASNGWASFTAIQQQYSYLRPKAGADFGINVNVDEELLDYLRANPDVTLMAFSPLLKGIYDDEKKRAAYYNWHLFNTDDSRARLDVLNRMAREMNISNSQLVMAWLLHHEPRVIPIVGVRTLEQFDIAMGALDIRLTPEQMDILNKASA